MKLFTYLFITIILTTNISLAANKKIEINKPTIGVIKTSLAAFLKQYILPNIQTPHLDFTGHFKVTEDGSVAKYLKGDIIIPIKNEIKLDLLQFNALKSPIHVLLGKPNSYLIGEISSAGSAGKYGETGVLKIYPVLNPEDLNSKILFPFIIENEDVGRVYIQIQDIIGEFQLTYKFIKYAHNFYYGHIYDPNVIDNLALGTKIKVNDVEYTISKKKVVDSLKFDIKLNTFIKMGDVNGRKFNSKLIQFTGIKKINSSIDKFEYDFIIN